MIKDLASQRERYIGSWKTLQPEKEHVYHLELVPCIVKMTRISSLRIRNLKVCLLLYISEHFT